MVENFSELERKLLKHWIQIHDNELNNQTNSLLDIYNDYGCPEHKSPWVVLSSFAFDIREKNQPLSFEDESLKKNLAQIDIKVDMTIAMRYLEIMDLENYNNHDLWIRFAAIENAKSLLDEMLDAEQNDDSNDYTDLPF